MNAPHTHTREPACGFTLIEVAVVLFIIGLMMSGIVAFITSTIANRRIEVTRTKQEAIKTALITFIARNYRLPCPALATLAEGAANEGVEATPSGGNCTGITASGSSPNQVVTGAVPWVSLGLTREVSLDAYTYRFTYQVVLGATGLTLSTVSGMTGRITVHSAGLGILEAAPTGNQTNDCSGGATVNPCAGVAVIVSHGKDGYGAYTKSGSQIAFESTVTGNDARENANGDRMFVVKDYSGTDANPFDDIVMVLTTNDLLSPLVIGGTLKDYRATLNAKIDVIKGAVIADAYKNGGIKNGGIEDGNRYYKLPNSMPSLLSTPQKTDPWNNLISYQKDSSLTDVYCSSDPSQLAFRLISPGPDGILGNADDISYTYTVLSGEIINIISSVGCNK